VHLAASDTDPETERVHLALIRQASPERRLRLAFSLSRTTIGLAYAGLQERFPDLSPEEVGLQLVARLYGTTLADEVRRDLAARRRR
jgi:hypothetical protein